MDFARRFLVIASVNKKWPPRLMSGINRGGLQACPPRRKNGNTSQKILCSSEDVKYYYVCGI
jgi:hypothetical protein